MNATIVIIVVCYAFIVNKMKIILFLLLILFPSVTTIAYNSLRCLCLDNAYSFTGYFQKQQSL